MNKDEPSGPRPSIDDRIVVPPAPGGRRSISPLRPTDTGVSDSTVRMDRVVLPETPGHTADDTRAELWVAWPGKPLASAAAPLLHLLAHVNNTMVQPGSGDLYQYAVRLLNAFELNARNAGVPAEQTRQAHYALCASLDDAVLNMPWGNASGWAKTPLTVTFHNDSGNDRFFELLARSLERPAKDLAVIEIMYLCLSLGFMGSFRTSPRGRDDLTRARETCYAAIAAQWQVAAPELVPGWWVPRGLSVRRPFTAEPFSLGASPAGPSTAELSVHWKGISAPNTRSRGRLPIWVVYAAGLTVCGAMFLWVSASLTAASDAQSARMLRAPPTRMPAILRAAAVRPPVAPLEISVLDRLRGALKADIDTGVVSVAGTPATVVLRVNTNAGFAVASATPLPALNALLERIGTALKPEPGTVRTIAYTDNQPVRTVRFPSNFELSGARASAAVTAIARTAGDPARLSAEGRGDQDPIASNATPSGREQNRRIDVVLRPPE